MRFLTTLIKMKLLRTRLKLRHYFLFKIKKIHHVVGVAEWRIDFLNLAFQKRKLWDLEFNRAF